MALRSWVNQRLAYSEARQSVALFFGKIVNFHGWSEQEKTICISAVRVNLERDTFVLQRSETEVSCHPRQGIEYRLCLELAGYSIELIIGKTSDVASKDISGFLSYRKTKQKCLSGYSTDQFHTNRIARAQDTWLPFEPIVERIVLIFFVSIPGNFSIQSWRDRCRCVGPEA